MKLQSTVSSPMRFEVVQGIFFVTCMNVADAVTGDHVCSMVQGESTVSFGDAKRNMWDECRELGIFNKPRVDM